MSCWRASYSLRREDQYVVGWYHFERFIVKDGAALVGYIIAMVYATAVNAATAVVMVLASLF